MRTRPGALAEGFLSFYPGDQSAEMQAAAYHFAAMVLKLSEVGAAPASRLRKR